MKNDNDCHGKGKVADRSDFVTTKQCIARERDFAEKIMSFALELCTKERQMKQTPILFDHPDDMNGQELIILVQEALDAYAGDCGICHDLQLDADEGAKWAERLALMESIGISEEVAAEPSYCHKHVWVVRGSSPGLWLGSVPINGAGDHMSSFPGLNEFLKGLYSDEFTTMVQQRIQDSCSGTHELGDYLFKVEILETEEEPA